MKITLLLIFALILACGSVGVTMALMNGASELFTTVGEAP